MHQIYVEKETIFFSLNMKYISIFSQPNFQFLSYDPKERNINNIENVTQGFELEGNIVSYPEFNDKVEIALWAFRALM